MIRSLSHVADICRENGIDGRTPAFAVLANDAQWGRWPSPNHVQPIIDSLRANAAFWATRNAERSQLLEAAALALATH